MAKGDVVNGISAAATILDFQPASGVECVVRPHINANSVSSVYAQLYNGTTASDIQPHSTVFNYSQMISPIYINNTRYLRIPALTAGSSSYSGIQTK